MKDFPDACPEVAEAPWLLDGIWLRKGINVIYGFEKAGKSRLMGYCISQMLEYPQGGPVLWNANGNGPVVKHSGFKRILYLNAEEMDANVQGRIWKYGEGMGYKPGSHWPLTVVEGTAVGLDLYKPLERQAFAETYLAGGRYDVLIIDPLRNIHTGDEDSSTAMSPMYQAIRQWTYKYGITIILVHHTPKLSDISDLNRIATWSRGSTALPAILDWANMLREVAKSGDDRIMSLLCKGRTAAEATYKLLDKGDPEGFKVQR